MMLQVLPIIQNGAEMGRQHYYFIDALRVYTFLFLIAYHTGLVFCGWRWHIETQIPNPSLEHYLQFLTQWRIPLLFTISGAGVAILFKKLACWKAFLLNRILRVLIPFTTALLIIIPIQIALERYWQGYPLTVFKSHPLFFINGYQSGGHFSHHHLWYLFELWNICFFGIPIFVILQRTRWLTRKTGSSVIAVIILGLIGAKILTFNNIYAHLAFFTLGFYLATAPTLYNFLAKHGNWILLFSTAAYLILAVFFWQLEYSSNPYMVRNGNLPIKLAYRILIEANALLWVLTFIGLSVTYLNYKSKFVHSLNRVILPMYIFHQVFLMALAVFFADKVWPTTYKIPLMFLITVLASYILSQLVLSFEVTRWLFGLKKPDANRNIIKKPPIVMA